MGADTRQKRRQRLWRAGAAAVLAALALGPVWLRSEVAGRDSTDITVTPVANRAPGHAGITVLGLWQLSALAENFGGYSALTLPGRDMIRLYSDKGWLLTIRRPDLPRRGVPQTSVRRIDPAGLPVERITDIEAATHNPATGQFWIGYEFRHAIYRYGRSAEPEAFVRPDYARQWADNSGIEAMVRLADGRFVVLHEGSNQGFLHNGDPVIDHPATRFTIAWPQGFSPTDAAELPDGRLLVLLRRLGWHLPPFEGLLVLVDPRRIDAARPLPVETLVPIEQVLPRDNWEAVTVEPGGEGSTVTVWLAADDNRSALQRSLLARVQLQLDRIGDRIGGQSGQAGR